MAEELIYKVGVEGTNELDKLEKSVDKAGKSVGKTKLYMSELRTELRKARGDMIKYAEGTDEYNRALARGSQITTQINDANAKMRIGVQDIGTTTKNVTGTWKPPAKPTIVPVTFLVVSPKSCTPIRILLLASFI